MKVSVIKRGIADGYEVGKYDDRNKYNNMILKINAVCLSSEAVLECKRWSIGALGSVESICDFILKKDDFFKSSLK